MIRKSEILLHKASPSQLSFSEQTKVLAEFLSNSDGRLAVISGAGVSVDSNIPDYRGPKGIYVRNKDYKPIQYSQFVGSHAVRQRYWQRSFLGWPTIKTAQPNATHRAISAFQRGGIVQSLITQNVDGLHSKAGSPDVLELHGSLHRVQCVQCKHSIKRDEFQEILRAMNPSFPSVDKVVDVDVASSSSKVNPDGDADIPIGIDYSVNYPTCPSCHTGILKPAVVFFGENLTPQARDRSFDIIDSAKNVLVVGSSLTVYSAFRLVRRAKEAGKSVAVVNLSHTRADNIVDIKIESPCSEILQSVENILFSSRP